MIFLVLLRLSNLSHPSCSKEPPPIHNYASLSDFKPFRLALQPENILVAWQGEWRIDCTIKVININPSIMGC